MIVIFKSTGENYRKELSGIKPNTLRKTDRTDKRFAKLRWFKHGWNNHATHICIENAETGEHFVREIKDVTEYSQEGSEDWMIISWKHEEEKSEYNLKVHEIIANLGWEKAHKSEIVLEALLKVGINPKNCFFDEKDNLIIPVSEIQREKNGN